MFYTAFTETGPSYTASPAATGQNPTAAPFVFITFFGRGGACEMWHLGQKKNAARMHVMNRQPRTTIAVMAAGPTGFSSIGIWVVVFLTDAIWVVVFVTSHPSASFDAAFKSEVSSMYSVPETVLQVNVLLIFVEQNAVVAPMNAW